MTYQPDYTAAVRTATRIVGPDYAEPVVMALLKSGEMVCVPSRKHVQGRKSYEQLLLENYALRDWLGVLIDECCALNYQQYIDYAKTLLRRVYGKESDRPVVPLPIVNAADRVVWFADQIQYSSMDLRESVRAYRRVRGSRQR